MHPYLVGLLPSSDRAFKKSSIASFNDRTIVNAVKALAGPSLHELLHMACYQRTGGGLVLVLGLVSVLDVVLPH